MIDNQHQPTIEQTTWNFFGINSPPPPQAALSVRPSRPGSIRRRSASSASSVLPLGRKVKWRKWQVQLGAHLVQSRLQFWVWVGIFKVFSWTFCWVLPVNLKIHLRTFPKSKKSPCSKQLFSPLKKSFQMQKPACPQRLPPCAGPSIAIITYYNHLPLKKQPFWLTLFFPSPFFKNCGLWLNGFELWLNAFQRPWGRVGTCNLQLRSLYYCGANIMKYIFKAKNHVLFW